MAHLNNALVIFIVLAHCKAEAQAKAKSDWYPQPEVVCCRSDSCPHRKSYTHADWQTVGIIIFLIILLVFVHNAPRSIATYCFVINTTVSTCLVWGNMSTGVMLCVR